jgi:hypothetical protein
MSEAIIQLNFSREETASGTKIQPIAFMDPITLVDSAASHLWIVQRLWLDKDPDFTRESTSLRLLSSSRRALGLSALRDGSPAEDARMWLSW